LNIAKKTLQEEQKAVEGHMWPTGCVFETPAL